MLSDTCKFNNQIILVLVPSDAPDVFLGIEILGQLPRTRAVCQIFLSLTDRYTELTIAILTTDFRSTRLAMASFNDGVDFYYIPECVLPGNVSNFAVNVSLPYSLSWDNEAGHKNLSRVIKWSTETIQRRDGREKTS